MLLEKGQHLFPHLLMSVFADCGKGIIDPSKTERVPLFRVDPLIVPILHDEALLFWCSSDFLQGDRCPVYRGIGAEVMWPPPPLYLSEVSN